MAVIDNMIVICPITVSIKNRNAVTEAKTTVILTDQPIPDTLIQASSKTNAGFRYLVPKDRLPEAVRHELEDAATEWATGQVGFAVSSIRVNLFVGKAYVPVDIQPKDEDDVDAALHDMLFELMMNSMEISYGEPEVLIANRGFIG